MGCVGCCGGLGRCCLCLLNTIFIILFAVVLLLVSAIWIYPDIPLALEMYEGEVLDEMRNISLVTVDAEWHITKLSLFTMFLYLVWSVTGVGILLSLCGCVGACCKTPKCVCAYSILVLILAIVQAVVMILLPLESNPYYTQMVSALDTSFTKYSGLGGGTDDDNGWTFIMWKYECCGVKGYEKSETFLQSISSTKSCCPPSFIRENKCTTSNMYDVGCANKLYETTAGSGGYMMIGPYLIAGQVLLVLFGCCVVLKAQLNQKVADELEERKPQERLPVKRTHDKLPPKENHFAISVVY
ncbi:uncharacterized protein [Argopecten irradians]|uniref:uncharacterized protein n=1 Tax=Argopecten irradians TaxID=31199 RepID=UPI00371EFEAD